MIFFKTMWKDWGCAATLHFQAKHFLDLAKQAPVGGEQESYIRASIVFAMMSFEAFFFREIIGGGIQLDRKRLDPVKVKKVEDGLNTKCEIKKALDTWPQLLTGKALDTAEFVKLLDYRNALIHGDITRPLSQWGNKLAQEVETVGNSELVMRMVEQFTQEAAKHFGFDPPPWV